MIRAKDISNLYEKYFTGRKSAHGYVEIFINPTKDELRQIITDVKLDPDARRLGAPLNSIRFSAVDKTKDVYAWHGDVSLHFQMRDMLNLSFGDPVKGIMSRSYWERGVLDGTAHFQGGTATTIACDVLENSLISAPEEVRLMLEHDWRWVDRYINITSYLRKFVEKHQWSSLKFPWM